MLGPFQKAGGQEASPSGWRILSSLSFGEGRQKPLVLCSGLAVSWTLTVLGSPVFWHWFRPSSNWKAVWA